MGQARNPANDRVSTSVRLPPDLLDRIDAEAKARIVGRSLLIENLLRFGLDQLPPITPSNGSQEGVS